MKNKHNWTKTDTIIGAAVAVIIGIPILLVALTDMETGMGILGAMVKILEIVLIIDGVLLGIIYGLMTVIRTKEKKSGIKTDTADKQMESDK